MKKVLNLMVEGIIYNKESLAAYIMQACAIKSSEPITNLAKDTLYLIAAQQWADENSCSLMIARQNWLKSYEYLRRNLPRQDLRWQQLVPKHLWQWVDPALNITLNWRNPRDFHEATVSRWNTPFYQVYPSFADINSVTPKSSLLNL